MVINVILIVKEPFFESIYSLISSTFSLQNQMESKVYFHEAYVKILHKYVSNFLIPWLILQQNFESLNLKLDYRDWSKKGQTQSLITNKKSIIFELSSRNLGKMTSWRASHFGKISW